MFQIARHIIVIYSYYTLIWQYAFSFSFCVFFFHHLAHLFMHCVVQLYPVCHKGSFSNKFHKTWFRVRKGLECIVLKQGTVI